ncbi:Sec-independent protein translocase protein TatB [Halomonas heilongjiangensis]|uniref:Sec-independent protein translocase protein TatB n=1 Tax=Halomonas heilongjiangensis TaxID=1387883 RepID=A0A2N7TQR6_9GAMM|nr:Sec-independent protein translocase protein TatB [Halomonas heilongjiangensis]PMR70536.1 twin-arginine translocase subunit TatB [Halomonas heilongjiangensis]PXX91297.1 twin-arginine translocase subunit TatB [Halomonas heilongjiangensis]
MFDMGFLELLIIGVVGLLVLGPERLPKAARTLGLWIGKVKRTVSGMQREISAQLEAEELRQKLNEQQKKLDESVKQVKRDVESLAEPESGGGKDTQQSPASGRDDTGKSAAPSEPPEKRLDDALARARLDPPADEPADAADKDATSR